jgi:signal peptidase
MRLPVRALVLILVLSSFFLLAVQSLPGLMVLHVVSGSMEPNVPLGSLVLLSRGEPPSMGDVAAYILEAQGRKYVILHRITGITGDGKYLFSADADPSSVITPVEPEKVLGKMLVAIPYLGYLAPYAPLVMGLLGVLLLVPKKVRAPSNTPADPGILRYLPAFLLPLSFLLPVKGLPALLGPLYLAVTVPVYAATLLLERQVDYSDLVYALLAASVIVSIDFAKLYSLLWGL